MPYQIAIKLHKLLNKIDHSLTFEHVTILANIVCTSRQTSYEILRICKNWHEYNS